MAEPDAPVLTVFRSRLRPEAAEAHAELLAEVEELARSMPGFVEIRAFVADDGERVSLVTFASQATHAAWRDHPVHRLAQQRGRHDFYSAYRVQVCDVVSDSVFVRQ